MIERLNEIITIQKNGVLVDQYGNHSNGWEDYFSCHAYAGTLADDEDSGEVVYEDRTITFQVRYCSELKSISSTGFRVMFHGEAYNILSVDMMNYQRKQIRLKCRREDRP